MNPMISCHVNVIMSAFLPSPTAGAPATVNATMQLTEQTPNPSGQPYFSLAGDQLAVSVPSGTPVRIEYSLVNDTGSSDLFYIFGMFFSNAPKKVAHDVGMFPLVLIAQDVPVEATIDGFSITPAPQTVSVVDQNGRAGLWEYTIGIQNLNTAAIGIFDPGIDNEQ